MRRILGLLLLSQAVVGFLPPSCPPLSTSTHTHTHTTTSSSNSNKKSTTSRWVLGGNGEFDLLKGSKPLGKADPAPGEFDLLGNIAGAEGAAVIKEDPHDVLLAELIFTTEDVREVIYKRLDDCDAKFVDFLENRIKGSEDIDERQALRSLVEMVDAIKTAVEKKKVEDAARAKEEQKRQLEEEARVMAEMAEAKKRAQTVQEKESQRQSQREEMQRMQGGANTEGAGEGEDNNAALKMDPKQSYEQMLEAFLGLDFGNDKYVYEVVEANYERCTMEFLDLLGERLNSGETAADVKNKLLALKGHIEVILQERMSRAAERLGVVVKAGSLDAMVDKIYELNEKGEIDEPLILLLETNAQQAERAGAAPAAELFKKLIATAQEAIDEKLTPSTRLIRRLLRVENAEKRQEILHEAFRPKATTLMADGAKSEAAPDVPPPDFIEELRQLIKNFGNINQDGFSDRLRALIEEAEEVSVSIYGKSMSHREQQEYMWQKSTVSIFDLEQLENKAQAVGDAMPWQNDAYDNMMPPGFEDGVRTIGGNDKSKF